MQGIGLIRLKILEVPCECGIEPPGSISHGVKPTGKRPLGRCRWEDNIRMDLKEISINARNWVDSAQDIGGSL